jgi:hypothetical protein
MKFLLLLLTIILVQACAEDSVLSDIELDNPSLIKPNVEFYKHVSSDASNIQHIVALLYDKNGNLIRLNNGKVLVNQKEMILKDYLLSNGKYYSGKEVIGDIEYPKNYKFDIILSNDKSYDLEITTQGTEFAYLNLETEHSKTENLIITWNPFTSSIPIDLQLLVYYRENDINATKTYNVKNIHTNSGYMFEIPSNYFTSNPETYKVNVEITSYVNGSVHSEFMNGSKIVSINSISKEVTIY